jgi:hypothetical protein
MVTRGCFFIEILKKLIFEIHHQSAPNSNSLQSAIAVFGIDKILGDPGDWPVNKTRCGALFWQCRFALLPNIIFLSVYY